MYSISHLEAHKYARFFIQSNYAINGYVYAPYGSLKWTPEHQTMVCRTLKDDKYIYEIYQEGSYDPKDVSDIPPTMINGRYGYQFDVTKNPVPAIYVPDANGKTNFFHIDSDYVNKSDDPKPIYILHNGVATFLCMTSEHSIAFCLPRDVKFTTPIKEGDKFYMIANYLAPVYSVKWRADLDQFPANIGTDKNPIFAIKEDDPSFTYVSSMYQLREVYNTYDVRYISPRIVS